MDLPGISSVITYYPYVDRSVAFDFISASAGMPSKRMYANVRAVRVFKNFGPKKVLVRIGDRLQGGEVYVGGGGFGFCGDEKESTQDRDVCTCFLWNQQK